MAKANAEEYGWNNILGIFSISFAALLLIALASYDPGDLGVNQHPPNESPQNLIGRFGAWVGFICFSVFGAASFLLPFFLAGFGLSYYFPIFHKLLETWQRRLVSLGVFLACMGMMDLLFSEKTLHWDAGGLIGYALNEYFFVLLFREIGAATIYLTVDAAALVTFTNLDVAAFLRDVWERFFRELWERFLDRLERFDKDASPEERRLKRQARKLAKEAKQLEANLALPAETPTYPEPTVLDHSVSASPPARKLPQITTTKREEKRQAKPSSAEESNRTNQEDATADSQKHSLLESRDSASAPPDKIGEETAEEADVATTADILGQPANDADAIAGAISLHKNTADAETEQDDTAPQSSKPAAASPFPKPIPKSGKKGPMAVAVPPVIGDYALPNIDFLFAPAANVGSTDSRDSLMANAKLMQNTLAQFGIKVALGDITKGPTITRYELHPAPGIKLERIGSLSNNIAAALKAERINILVPVPGKGSVGIEIPNAVKTKVIIRDLLESEEWTNTKARLPLVLGKDVYGRPMVVDLAEMPHLLIAGSTGSGKSVCINAIIASLLYRYSPEDLRFVMIDPKVVELQQYNSLPHLVVPVVTDPKKVVLALRWVVNEMEKRYQIFAKVGVRNIQSFNERPNQPPANNLKERRQRSAENNVADHSETSEEEEGFAVEIDEEITVPRDEDILIPEKLSYIVVVIDELADLMLVAPADVEMAIARITQMARAAGIHCIVATQRPSVDVITGVIKANIPARIAFQVASKTDSRTILDSMGADKLLGKGDMLYLPPGSAKLIRAQGVLITDEEIQNIVDHITRQGTPRYEMEIHQQLTKPVSSNGDSDEDQELIQKCIEVIRSEQKASVSLLQRRLRIGYTRAARIMDEIENLGIVGPSKGAEPREIFIDLDNAEEHKPNLPN